MTSRVLTRIQNRWLNLKAVWWLFNHKQLSCIKKLPQSQWIITHSYYLRQIITTIIITSLKIISSILNRFRIKIHNNYKDWLWYRVIIWVLRARVLWWNRWFLRTSTTTQWRSWGSPTITQREAWTAKFISNTSLASRHKGKPTSSPVSLSKIITQMIHVNKHKLRQHHCIIINWKSRKCLRKNRKGCRNLRNSKSFKK